MSNPDSLRAVRKLVSEHTPSVLYIGAVLSALLVVLLDQTWFTNILGHSKHDFLNIESTRGRENVMLCVLASIAAFFFLERRTLSDFSNEFELLNTLTRLNRGSQKLVMSHISNLNQLWDLLEKDDSSREFKDMGKTLLSEHELQIMQLSKGVVSVPMDASPKYNLMVLEQFKTCMDAVAYDDLSFWQQINLTFQEDLLDEYTGKRYYEHILDAKRKGTRVTRIFIIKQSDLLNDEHLKEYSMVLQRHHKDGIGFGVAVDMYLSAETRASKDAIGTRGSYDFALFDTNRAVSFFGKEGRQRFTVVYPVTGDALNLVERQGALYDNLVLECCFVNRAFIDAVEHKYSEDEIRRMIRTESQRRTVFPQGAVTPEHNLFLYTLNAEFATDTEQLAAIVKALKAVRALGRHYRKP